MFCNVIASLRKPGSGGRREGAGRKPGRKLPRLARLDVGAWCEGRWQAEVDAKFNEGLSGRTLKPEEDRRIFVNEGGKRPWGVRTGVIEAAIAFCAGKYGISVKPSYISACWAEYRKFSRLRRRVGSAI
jgi:hypothetical protein